MSSLEQILADSRGDPKRLAQKIQLLEEKLHESNHIHSQSERKLQELQEALSCKEQQLAEAEAVIAELRRQLFGRKSEKLTSEQQEQLDELAEDLKEASQRQSPLSQDILQEEQKKKNQEKSAAAEKRQAKRRRRHPDPVALETERVILEPEETSCGHCQKAKRKIGQEVTTEYDYIPAKLIRREIIRLKYAPGCHCHDGDDTHGISIAALPERLLPQSRLGLGLAVYILLSRFDDHIAYYTLERIFWERYGIVVPRQQMVQWMEKIAFWLLSLYELLWQEIKKGNYMQIDESPVKVLDPEVKGKAGQGFLWFFSVPGKDVFLVFDSSRGHQVPLERLEGFEGTIQVDGYNAYKTLDRKIPGIRRIGCLAHARRKFYTALEESVADAVWFISQIRELYRIEREIAECSCQERFEIRDRKARPIWEAMKAQAEGLLSQKSHLPQSSMGKAIQFFLSEYTAMVGYLDDGQFEIDNNLIENDVRPAAVGRKRWLFIGHPNAGWRSAVLYTFIQSCRRRDINPQEYFTDVLARLPSMKTSELSQLLPGNWKPQPKPPTDPPADPSP